VTRRGGADLSFACAVLLAPEMKAELGSERATGRRLGRARAEEERERSAAAGDGWSAPLFAVGHQFVYCFGPAYEALSTVRVADGGGPRGAPGYGGTAAFESDRWGMYGWLPTPVGGGGAGGWAAGWDILTSRSRPFCHSPRRSSRPV
jgi:hypothetical protein